MEQKNLFDFEIGPAWLYKKDIVNNPIEVWLLKIEKEVKDGRETILAHIFSKEQGDRIVNLRAGQYTYLKNKESILRSRDYKVYMKSYKKSDKEYSMILSLDNEVYI